MKHRTIATALILFVLLFFMIWSFGSSAANPNEPVAKENSLPKMKQARSFRRGEAKREKMPTLILANGDRA
jgi:choline-glycine betaine transporter